MEMRLGQRQSKLCGSSDRWKKPHCDWFGRGVQAHGQDVSYGPIAGRADGVPHADEGVVSTARVPHPPVVHAQGGGRECLLCLTILSIMIFCFCNPGLPCSDIGKWPSVVFVPYPFCQRFDGCSLHHTRLSSSSADCMTQQLTTVQSRKRRQ